MTTIRCHPKKEPLGITLFALLAGFILFVAILFVSMTMLVWVVTGSLMSKEVKTVLWLSSVLGGACLIRRFWQWGHDRFIWTLTDKELICGPSRHLTIPLIEVEKIIVGLPIVPGMPRAFEGLVKFIGSSSREIIETQRSQGLLLILNEQRMLPLNLHQTINGPELMLELTKRFAHLVDSDYKFSSQEIQKLTRSEFNVLINLSK